MAPSRPPDAPAELGALTGCWERRNLQEMIRFNALAYYLRYKQHTPNIGKLHCIPKAQHGKTLAMQHNNTYQASLVQRMRASAVDVNLVKHVEFEAKLAEGPLPLLLTRARRLRGGYFIHFMTKSYKLH